MFVDDDVADGATSVFDDVTQMAVTWQHRAVGRLLCCQHSVHG